MVNVMSNSSSGLFGFLLSSRYGFTVTSDEAPTNAKILFLSFTSNLLFLILYSMNASELCQSGFSPCMSMYEKTLTIFPAPRLSHALALIVTISPV